MAKGGAASFFTYSKPKKAKGTSSHTDSRGSYVSLKSRAVAMKRAISSRLTFFYKIVVPVISVAIPGIVVPSLMSQEPDKRWGLQLAMAIGLLVVAAFVVFLLVSIPLKYLEIDDQFLFVSNFRRTIMVPLSEIEQVGYPFPGLRPLTASVKFKNPTAFGNEILFLPRVTFWSFSHSTADDLRDIAGKRRSERALVSTESEK
jgi:hypothetical protein